MTARALREQEACDRCECPRCGGPTVPLVSRKPGDPPGTVSDWCGRCRREVAAWTRHGGRLR